MSFFNTIKESGQTLINFNDIAQTQEEMIYNYFLNVRKPLAWFQINLDINPCSVKRSLTNLCYNDESKTAKLIKTKDMVMGPYSKKCHLYKLI